MAFSADELLKALTLLLDEQRRQSEEWRRKELEYEKLSLAFEKMKKKCGWFDGYYVSRYVAEYSSAMREFDVSEAEAINNFEFLAESYIRQDVSEVKGEFGGSWKTYKQALRRRFWRNDFDADEYIVDKEVEADTSVLVDAPVDYKKVVDSADSAASVEELVGILAEVPENSDATSELKDISASIGSFLERFAVTTGIHEVPVEVQVQKDDVTIVEAEENSVVASGIDSEEGSATDIGENSDFTTEVEEFAVDTGGSFATATREGSEFTSESEGFAADTEGNFATHVGDSSEFAAEAEEFAADIGGDSATDVGKDSEFAAEAERFAADIGGDSATDVGKDFEFDAEAERFTADTGGDSVTDVGKDSEFAAEAERFAADIGGDSATDVGKDFEFDAEAERFTADTGGDSVTIGGSSADVDGVSKRFVVDIDVSSTYDAQEISPVEIARVSVTSIGRVGGVLGVDAKRVLFTGVEKLSTVVAVEIERASIPTTQICSCLMTGGGEDVLHRFVMPVLLCLEGVDVVSRHVSPSK
ncbi:hypothetical protein R1sor_014613 [Riccia sorocarpa]|uniref:Uncharacterized protein n=1 Tax=Riccia sorocarpa TaxID=122646 RepID=A0ABD3HCR4_9MARC